jgi:hypothetical protein
MRSAPLWSIIPAKLSGSNMYVPANANEFDYG